MSEKITPPAASAQRLVAAGIAFVLAALICAAVYANGTLPLALDEAVRDFFISIRNDFTDIAVIGLTHLGDTVTIVALCIVLLILPNRKTYGLPVSLAALAGVAVYKPLKHLFLRARPDELLHLVEQGGYSFPSGHSVSVGHRIRPAALSDPPPLPKRNAAQDSDRGVQHSGASDRSQPAVRERALGQRRGLRHAHRSGHFVDRHKYIGKDRRKK